MASSVSSERAFSAAGITISKRRNRLKGDIVEALQFLKCMIRRDLLFREDMTPNDELELEKLDATEGQAAELDRSILVADGSVWIPLDDGNEDWEDSE